jgi:hypothetical protein
MVKIENQSHNSISCTHCKKKASVTSILRNTLVPENAVGVAQGFDGFPHQTRVPRISKDELDRIDTDETLRFIAIQAQSLRDGEDHVLEK